MRLINAELCKRTGGIPLPPKFFLITTQTQNIMALELQDLMALKSMGKEDGMTPYESVKLDHMAAKSHTSGVAVAGLVTGVVGVTAGVTAWLFGGLFANAKGNQAKEAAQAAKETAVLLSQGNQRQLDQLTQLFAAERQERISGDVTLNQTITDTVSGQQASTLTAQQQAELAASQATQQVMTQTYSDFVTGRASLNPTPVSLYSSPQPCNCPMSGCGCNG